MSGGVTAAGLLVLFLALIAIVVGLYYAYICLQARPLRPKKHKDAERGPLIPPDPDVNGNHEDVPLVEASAPLHEDVDPDHKLHPDLPDEDTSAPDPPVSHSPQPPREKEDILISVEEDVPPAKLAHEKETAPVLNHVAPLGFVVPPAVAPPQETPLDQHPEPRNLQSPPKSSPQVEPSPSDSAPVPVYIPPPAPKKPVAISDEEDGLLLQEPLPQGNSPNLESCHADFTVPVSHPSPKSSPNEEPETTSQTPPLTSLPKSEMQPPKKEVAPLKSETETPRPELTSSSAPTTQPPATTPKVSNTPQPGTQPIAVVSSHPAPDCSEKEKLIPVGKALDMPPIEDKNKAPPVCMKEDDEQLPTPTTREDTTDEIPDNMKDKMPKVNIVPSETVEPINKESLPDSDNSRPPISEPNENSDPNEGVNILPDVESPPLENNKVEGPVEEMKLHEEELRADSSCSMSSEEPVPPYYPTTNAEVTHQPTSESAALDGSSQIHPKDSEEKVVPVDEVVVSGDGESVPDVSETVPADNPISLPTKKPEESIPTTPTQGATEEPLLNTHETEHASYTSSDTSSGALSDTSDTHRENDDIPAEASVIPTSVPHDVTPLEAASYFPIDTSHIPLEAYVLGDSDDCYEEESSPLPVIREEGSAETDTESSEPEVTEYSFSSGPSAPSTTEVLANEVSCALEPKVTKYAPITNLDASESNDESSVDESLEEEDVASLPEEEVAASLPEEQDTISLPKEEDTASLPEVHNGQSHDDSNTDVEKEINEANECSPSSSNSDVSKQNSTPFVVKPDLSNGPASSEAPELATDSKKKLPEEEESISTNSDTDSEGVEAEAEFREEVVSIPAVVCGAPKEHTPASPEAPPSLTNTHTDDPADACAQPVKTPQEIKISQPKVPIHTDDDGLSLSVSESSSLCDLSDGEVATSTPKKSMIPRLVKHSEA